MATPTSGWPRTTAIRISESPMTSLLGTRIGGFSPAGGVMSPIGRPSLWYQNEKGSPPFGGDPGLRQTPALLDDDGSLERLVLAAVVAGRPRLVERIVVHAARFHRAR